MRPRNKVIFDIWSSNTFERDDWTWPKYINRVALADNPFTRPITEPIGKPRHSEYVDSHTLFNFPIILDDRMGPGEIAFISPLPIPNCPNCHTKERVIKIYRPEIFEFAFLCLRCDKGFN